MVEGLMKGAAKMHPLCRKMKAVGTIVARETNSRTENMITRGSRTTTVRS